MPPGNGQLGIELEQLSDRLLRFVELADQGTAGGQHVVGGHAVWTMMARTHILHVLEDTRG
ncbi:MAG: hypothetical protein O7F71_12130 [Gammaproteobacteria bacterium]|nr:hypothetical protein [Gammaproteobacteria bacterium]